MTPLFPELKSPPNQFVKVENMKTSDLSSLIYNQTPTALIGIAQRHGGHDLPGFVQEVKQIREQSAPKFREQMRYFLPHYPSHHMGVSKDSNRSFYRLDPRDMDDCGLTVGLDLYTRTSKYPSFKGDGRNAYRGPFRYYRWPLIPEAPKGQFHPLGFKEFNLSNLLLRYRIELFAGSPFDWYSSSDTAKRVEVARLASLITARAPKMADVTFQVDGWRYTYDRCHIEDEDMTLKIVLRGIEEYGQEYVIQW